jgi:hypothetical protein
VGPNVLYAEIFSLAAVTQCDCTIKLLAWKETRESAYTASEPGT